MDNQAPRDRKGEARKRALDYYYENKDRVLKKTRERYKLNRADSAWVVRERARAADYRKNNAEQISLYHHEHGIYKRYGITKEVYDAMLVTQSGKCAICGNKPRANGLKRYRRLHIDHCHATGRVRGLLCFRCNSGLGMFRESAKIMRKAIAYLTTEGQLTGPTSKSPS